MSEQTIARWNAIPVERPPESSLKRQRQDDMDDDEDDDVSLVSRSPSPGPRNDAMDIDKYDEYVRGAPREVITVETKIKPTNKGFALLAKLGWVEGRGVGASGEGRVDPVPFQVKSDLTGLGKTTQDVRMIETTVAQRRELDSERQQKESEEQRKLREDTVARKSALESEISSTLQAFYCQLCEKQFKTVAQYDEHTNSYAHHHKARFKDMQANARLKPKEEVDKRKEKERKREEKELRKIAAAQGIKMAKPSAAVTSLPLAAASGSISTGTDMDIDGAPVVPKKSGWAAVSGSSASTASSNPQPGFSRSSWASVGSSSSTSTSTLPPPSSSTSHPRGPASAHSRFSHADTSSSSNAPQGPAEPQQAQHRSAGHDPTFRNAGWTSLDTGSSQTQHPPPSQPPPAPSSGFSGAAEHQAYPGHGIGIGNVQQPQQPTSPQHQQPPMARRTGGWQAAGSGFSATPSAISNTAPPPPPPPRQQWQSSLAPPPPPSSAPPPPPPAASTLVLPPPPPQQTPAPPPPVEAKPARSNWQQFQKGVGRRK